MAEIEILMSEETDCIRMDILFIRRPQTTLHVLKNHPKIEDKLAEAVRGIATGMIYYGYDRYDNNYQMINGRKWDSEKREIVNAQSINSRTYQTLESTLINEMTRLSV